MPDDKMGLWNSVCKTNPDDTKRVDQRGGFTAICAHSQLRRATELWGRCGGQWGYDVEHSVIDAGAELLAVCDVTVWHYPEAWEAEREPPKVGPVRGCASLLAKGRWDTDAPKKAMTDALTKCLSHWGFNADVFLGLFDDNKYINQMKEEFREAPKPATRQDDVYEREQTPELREKIKLMLNAFHDIGWETLGVMNYVNSNLPEELTEEEMLILRKTYQRAKAEYDEQHERGA